MRASLFPSCFQGVGGETGFTSSGCPFEDVAYNRRFEKFKLKICRAIATDLDTGTGFRVTQAVGPVKARISCDKIGGELPTKSHKFAGPVIWSVKASISCYKIGGEFPTKSHKYAGP
jgi:hypothetical protein